MLRLIITLIYALASCCVYAQPVESELQLVGGAGMLGGTLTVPATGQGQANWIVLIVAGSGPTDRDGNSSHATNNSLKMLAHGLANAGIASVRYDKRGVGASLAAAPSEDALRFETYVDDAAAWIKLLKTNNPLSKIAVLGHSEGALIAMLAVQATKPDAYVSVAGAGRKASDIIRAQLANKLPADLTKENERILSTLERQASVAEIPPPLSALYRSSVQPYLMSWFKYNPVQVLQAITIPVLLIQGTTDIQVDSKDFELLSQAAPAATRSLIPGMNHILKMVEPDISKQKASYANASLPISPMVIRTIDQFLKEIPKSL
jgi:pimeloyl-ACP methyl ester carboxylesterase